MLPTPASRYDPMARSGAIRSYRSTSRPFGKRYAASAIAWFLSRRGGFRNTV